MTALNLEQARFNMIEQQIRTWEVLDQLVLDSMMLIPREDFVPQPQRALAFTDMGLPIGHGELMMQPKLEARVLQALALTPQDTVLEIGTGSAYLTALLASLTRHVFSVDIQTEFTDAARRKLAEHNIHNVTLESGDAAQGWPTHAPYDVIVVTGSLPVLPEAFQKTLAISGRLLALIGDAPAMELTLITRVGANEFAREVLFETVLAPLQNALQPERFVL